MQAGGGHRTSRIIWTGEFQPNWVKMDPDYGDLDGEWGAHERMKWEEDWGVVLNWYLCVCVCACTACARVCMRVFLGETCINAGVLENVVPSIAGVGGGTDAFNTMSQSPTPKPSSHKRTLHIHSIHHWIRRIYVCLLLTSIQPVTIHTPLLTTIHVGLHGLLMYVTSSSMARTQGIPRR